MSDPVTLIVLVAAGEASNPISVAMAHSMRDALGGAAIEVRETRRSPTDAEALAVEDTMHPDAVVELIWGDMDHRKVTLRVLLARSKGWLERSMAYTASDPVGERGRTLGLAIASTLPAISPSRETTTARSPPDSAYSSAYKSDAGSFPGTDALAPISAPARLPATILPRGTPDLTQRGVPESLHAVDALHARAAGSTPSPTAETESEQVPATTNPRSGRPHLEVQLIASGAAGVGGSANSAGGGGAAQWFVSPWLSVRLGAAERSGDLSIAEGTLFTFYGAAGISVQPWQATRARPLDVSIRLDYLAVRQSVTHFDSDDPRAVIQARWLSGADAFLDTGWLLSPDVAALAGLGLEDVMAPTYVDVRNARVATIPPLRVVAELGVRLRF